MLIRHPSNDQELSMRGKLLQEALRPEPLRFSIEEEYPLVLSRKTLDKSYCLFENSNICAHANLLEKRVIDENSTFITDIGLVGNVATAKKSRGKGYMKVLMDHLETIALKKNLSALILWSDLDQFYQKLGFQSLGEENLIQYNLPTGSTDKLFLENNLRLESCEVSALSKEFYSELMDLRPKGGPTLERSLIDFKTQLSIPHCELIILKSKNKVESFYLIGKGYDMRGVIHEWGFENETFFQLGINQLLSKLNMESIFFLAPSWQNARCQFLKSIAVSCQSQPMAFVKFTNQQPELQLDDLFVWGLDSI